MLSPDILPNQNTQCRAVLVASADQALALEWLLKEIVQYQAQYPQRQLAVLWDGKVHPFAFNQLGSVPVQSLLAGCVCCVGGLVLKTAIVKVLRAIKPDTLWIVGGSTALLSAMADAVQSPLLAMHIKVVETAWLVLPGSPPSHTFEQIECASVGVNTNLLDVNALTHPWVPRFIEPKPDEYSVDHLWPADALFDRKLLLATFKKISEVTTIKGRLDGIFRTQRTHYYGASIDKSVTWRETSWRIDSRIKLTATDTKKIVPTLQTLREQFEACLTR